MKHIYQPVFYLLLLFLAGCKVGKEYQRPEVELPKQFSAVAFADTSSIADLEWKEFFRDKDLLSLIEQGLQHNYDLQLATQRIEIAQKQLAQSRVLMAPDIDARLGAQFNRPSDNSLNGLSTKNFLGKTHIENYTALVQLSWEADIWGKIRAQKGIALTQYLQSQESRRAIQTSIVAAIAQGYYNLLVMDQQLAIAKRTLLLNDSFVVATRMLKDAGLANSLAVQQAAAQKQATSILIPQLEESIALQENALQLLTGQLPGAIKRGRTLEQPFPETIHTGIPAALLSRRPDVRHTELELHTANARVGIAQANMYPALNITAGAGLESFKASNWLNIPGSLFGLAAGSLAQPIFRKRALRTAYEIATIEREQSVVRFRQSVLQAVTEVSNALVQVEKVSEQEMLAGQHVDILRSAINDAQFLFRSDMANYLEVITAQSNALQAELNLTALRGRKWKQLVELYRALGGGWK